MKKYEYWWVEDEYGRLKPYSQVVLPGGKIAKHPIPLLFPKRKEAEKFCVRTGDHLVKVRLVKVEE